MNSIRADALRLIFPLAALGATVDFFGTDLWCEAELVEVLLCLDDVLRVPLDEDDRDRALF